MNKTALQQKIGKLEDKLTEQKLELAALDGDEAAGAKIAHHSATAKINQATTEFDAEMAAIEASVKRVYEEESKKLEDAVLDDTRKSLEK